MKEKQKLKQKLIVFQTNKQTKEKKKHPRINVEIVNKAYNFFFK